MEGLPHEPTEDDSGAAAPAAHTSTRTPPGHLRRPSLARRAAVARTSTGTHPSTTPTPARASTLSRTFLFFACTAGEPFSFADDDEDGWNDMFGDDEDEGEEEEVDDSEARRRAVWASVVCRRRCHPCGRSLDSVRACPSHGWVSASQPGSEDLPERQAHRSTRRCARPSACSCACLCCPMPWCSTLFAACLRPTSRRCLEHRDSLGGCGAAQCAASDGPHVFACCVRVSMAMFAVM
jgi:hypothetical protein